MEQIEMNSEAEFKSQWADSRMNLFHMKGEFMNYKISLRNYSGCDRGNWKKLSDMKALVRVFNINTDSCGKQ